MLDHLLCFKHLPFPNKFPKSLTLETMMESILVAQQKQDDEYIEQLVSRVDVLTTYNKMLKAQIG